MNSSQRELLLCVPGPWKGHRALHVAAANSGHIVALSKEGLGSLIAPDHCGCRTSYNNLRLRIVLRMLRRVSALERVSQLFYGGSKIGSRLNLKTLEKVFRLKQTRPGKKTAQNLTPFGSKSR